MLKLVKSMLFCYHLAHMRLYLAILTSAFLLNACSIERILQDTGEDLQKKFKSIEQWEELPLRRISWNQALAMILEHNREMRRADSNIDSAERSVRSVYTDLIPSLGYYSSFSNSISGLIEASNAGSSSYNIQVGFSLPSLTQVPYRVYSAQASAYAAVKAREGKIRELSSQLYKNIRTREIYLRTLELDKKNPDARPKNRQEVETEYNTESQFWQTMANLLGDNSARWMVIKETMPRIKWSDYRKRLDSLDELVVVQLAMRIEQARLQQYGVALNYLPTMNANLYSPSLFSSTAGTFDGAFLSGDDTTINMSISYSLDTKLSNWNTYKTNKENYELVCQEVINELITRRNTLRKLRNSFDEYEVWKSFMQKKIAYMKATPPDSAEEFIDNSRLIIDMERELLNQEKRSVETEASVLLEYGFHGDAKKKSSILESEKKNSFHY